MEGGRGKNEDERLCEQYSGIVDHVGLVCLIDCLFVLLD